MEMCISAWISNLTWSETNPDHFTFLFYSQCIAHFTTSYTATIAAVLQISKGVKQSFHHKDPKNKYSYSIRGVHKEPLMSLKKKEKR